MFGDIGWAELLVIGVVALIVIGPEDLPQMFRQIGRFTAKIRAMGREFSRAMEQAAKDSGVNDVAKDLKAATSAKAMGLDKVKEAADRFEKWDPIKNAAKPTAAPAPRTVPAAASTIHGPETAALINKAAEKKAILAETAEKLKAVDAPAAQTAVQTAAKPAAKPRAKKPTAAAVEPQAEVTATPRATRKKKADQA